MKMKGEDRHLQAKERGLRTKLNPAVSFILRLPASGTARNNFFV